MKETDPSTSRPAIRPVDGRSSQPGPPSAINRVHRLLWSVPLGWQLSALYSLLGPNPTLLLRSAK